MKHLVLTLLMTAAVLAACSTKEPPQAEAAPGQLAAQAAQQAYDALYSGHTQDFLDAHAYADEMPQEYSRQRLEAYALHVQTVNHERRGVSRVVVTRTVSQPREDIIEVFLMLNYADGSQEEIVVPMTRLGGRWMIKN